MSIINSYTSVMFNPACETGTAQIFDRMSEKEFFDCLFKLFPQGDADCHRNGPAGPYFPARQGHIKRSFL